MSATHPWAMRLEALIEHLRRMLAALRRAKKSAKDAATPGFEGPEFVPYAVTRQVPGSGSAETQGTVTPGGGLFSSDKRNAMSKDPTLRALNEKHARALEACARERRAAAATGSKTLADGTVVRNAPRQGVSIPCPAATALAKQIDAYIARVYGKKGRSGGGGGGGW